MNRVVIFGVFTALVTGFAAPALAVQKGAPGEIEQGSCNCTGGTGWCHVEGLPMQCLAGKYPDGSDPCTGTCKVEAPTTGAGGNSIIFKTLKNNGATFSKDPPPAN